MPFFIKSAVPGLSTRTATVLQCLLVLLVVVLATLPRASERQEVAAAAEKPAPAPAPAPAEPADHQEASMAFSTIEVVVSRNDTMDRLFRRFELNLADLAMLRGLPELRTQLDRLKPGELLRLVHRGNELIGLERKLSDSETLKVTRDANGFSSDILENPLEVHTRTASATIESSLFQAAAAAQLDDRIALGLAEIFQYDIDFVLDIQQGDRFTVVYEELSQDGVPLRSGNILAAKFVNQGREYRAVRYVDEQGKADYFTPDGRSLRKAFIRAPVQFTRISSRFNPSRRHPVLNRIRAHKGVDYAAPVGTPVRAAGDGRVRFVGRKGGYGNVVELEHGSGVVTVYGHLSRFASKLHRGQRVALGEVIAYVGMTGLATGPHLHYEYRIRGVHKNPQTVPLPEAQPIQASERDRFLADTAGLVNALDLPAGRVLVAR
ncbi:MAG TPA: peptidoglycan DD-metalloendopeptidase family protein [Steroidobacteraceae bacterium]|nr:peptidoglycan DD-metalloendopeptidase family protein [Steroidobacteraceae bacterium]